MQTEHTVAPHTRGARTVAPHSRRTNTEALSAAAKKRHDKTTYAESIARDWPELTDEKRAEIAAIMRPLLDEEGGN